MREGGLEAGVQKRDLRSKSVKGCLRVGVGGEASVSLLLSLVLFVVVVVVV